MEANFGILASAGTNNAAPSAPRALSAGRQRSTKANPPTASQVLPMATPRVHFAHIASLPEAETNRQAYAFGCAGPPQPQVHTQSVSPMRRRTSEVQRRQMRQNTERSHQLCRARSSKIVP